MSHGTISLSQLENHLWESANILRGPVDAADFKTYIFPLLFFKRICDVWDEEYQEIVVETGDEQLAWFPESHRFQIPEDCHWNDVRTKASNVGAALQRAMREIEKANPDTLYGVFGDAQWSNKERLSDALLKDLIEHFSKLPFGNKNVNSDLLGDAYEYLIKKFADATNKKAGEFYTPRSVVRLMIDMLDPKEIETIYDPACGTGGMLLAAVQHVKEMHGDVKRLWGKLYGQEKNLTTSSIARMNLFLHGIEDFHVVRGDTLRNPAFFEGDRLATFDCVIANPPFSLEKWGEDLWLNDPFGRNFAGLPPSSSGDFAWVQHMVKSMADVTGRMAVVLPQGTLFRKGVESDIRQKLLEMDLVEAVIGLAPILGSFTLFATNKKKQRIKIICRYQQFEAANKIVERVLAGYPRKGLIWHFQGSGKSLLMVFAAQKLRMHSGLKNPTVLIVVEPLTIRRTIGAKNNEFYATIDFKGEQTEHHSEGSFSVALFRLLGLEPPRLVSNKGEEAQPYISTLLPVFYLIQGYGYSAAYRSLNSFIEDQFAEMVRFAFGLNPKHSYDIKKTLIEEKSALEAQTRKIVAAQRVLEFQSRGVDDSDANQAVLRRRAEDLTKQIDALRASVDAKGPVAR